MTMQAIITKFYGPTNHKGSRMKATCDAGTVWMSYEYGLNIDGNHAKAAKMLIDKLGWNTDYYGELVMGGLPGNQGYAHVFTK